MGPGPVRGAVARRAGDLLQGAGGEQVFDVGLAGGPPGHADTPRAAWTRSPGSPVAGVCGSSVTGRCGPALDGLDGPGPPGTDSDCRRACCPARPDRRRPAAPIGRPRTPPPLPRDGHHRRSQPYWRRTDGLLKIGRSAVRPRPWPPKGALDQRKQNLLPLVEGPSSICRPPTARRPPWPAGHDHNPFSSTSRTYCAHDPPARAHGARPEQCP